MYTTAQIQGAIPERIDRLPMSREIWRIMLLAGVAWLIESYDIGIIGNILPSLEKQYSLSSAMVGALAVASTLGIVVAVIPAGWLADRIGRKRILVVGTAWYAVFSLLCGLVPNIPVLLVLRFIAGLGMGAVFPIPYALAAELISQRFRGAMAAVLDSFLSFGYFLAPVLALTLIPQLPADQGWRVLFFVGGLPLLYVPVLLKWMPESPRWLQSRGQVEQADRIVSRLETVIERHTGRSLPEPQISATVNTIKQKLSPASIFKHEYRKRTLMMWVSFACILFIFYAIQTYTPTVLIKQGYGFGGSFLLTSISIMSFFGIGVDPVIKIYGAEQYPTSIRETGISFFEAVGRLFGGALAPYIMALTLASVGIPGSYVFVAILAVIGVLAVALLGTETKGRSIEEVSEGVAMVREKVA